MEFTGGINRREKNEVGGKVTIGLSICEPFVIRWLVDIDYESFHWNEQVDFLIPCF